MGPSHLDVLLDHPEFVVINKPAGIPVIPERFDTSGDDLHTLVKVRFGDSMMVVHRIDRETSGIVLFARSAEAHRHLSLQFQDNKVRKTYLALVVGAPLWDERTVDLPLRADGDRRHRTLVDAGRGKPSTTDYRVLERLGPYSLVEAHPLTGRTHQVRVHLAAMGAPIAVDPLYGTEHPILLSSFKRRYTPSAREERPLLARLGLHASALGFTSLSGEDITVEAPLPRDLNATLNQLRKHAR